MQSKQRTIAALSSLVWSPTAGCLESKRPWMQSMRRTIGRQMIVDGVEAMDDWSASDLRLESKQQMLGGPEKPLGAQTTDDWKVKVCDWSGSRGRLG